MSGSSIGQRVRMSQQGRDSFPHDKTSTGTVAFLGRGMIKVRRDGYSRTRLEWFAESFWEVVPISELTLDHACVYLANAVLTGDSSAAFALADRVMELRGATVASGGEA